MRGKDNISARDILNQIDLGAIYKREIFGHMSYICDIFDDKQQVKIISQTGRDIFGHMTHIPARHLLISSIWESLLLLRLERFKQEHKVSCG